jgi:hypothetical protein
MDCCIDANVVVRFGPDYAELPRFVGLGLGEKQISSDQVGNFDHMRSLETRGKRDEGVFWFWWC